MNQEYAPQQQLETKDYLAIILSLFLPGVGHMMLGQVVKGIVIFAVTVCTCAGGGLLLVAVALDAFCVARALKERPVGDWEFFPQHQRFLGF